MTNDERWADARRIGHEVARLMTDKGYPYLPPARVDLLCDFLELADQVERLPSGDAWLRSTLAASLTDAQLAAVNGEMRDTLK